MEAVGIDLENKYTYSATFPKLEHLAALATAKDLCNYHYSHDEQECDRAEFKEVNEIINDMKVPNCIRKKIIALCETIKKQMDYYSKSNTDLMRMCHTLANRYHFFLHGAVWDVNGHINEKKTAEKVLQCSEQQNDNDLMFEVITKYCLENRIRDFPISSLSDFFIKNTIRAIREDYFSRGRQELAKYWIDCKRREENASGGYEDSFQNNLRRLLDHIVLARFSEWPVCAYEYFWDFLVEREQVTMTKNLIRKDKKYQMALFSKMNRDQLGHLYLENHVVIIANYFGVGELELAIATWERVKLTITEVQFENLINLILDSEMYCENNNIQCLIDLWNTAPDNLIDYMIKVKNCAIIDKFFLNNPKSRTSCSSFSFLKVVLLQTTLEFRKTFFLKKGSHLLLNYPRNLFRSIIEDCLDASDQLKITEALLVTAMQSEPAKILRYFCNLLYSSVEEFHEFLKFLTPDADLQTRVKKRLLRSGVLIVRKLIRIDNWKKLCQLIDELYPNDEKEARRQKKKTFNSFLRSHFHYWSCFRRNGDDLFAEIDNLLAQIFTPQEMVTFKEDIMRQFQTACSNTGWRSDIVVKRVDIPKLSAWCYHGDEEKISQFKSSFPIDTAFQLFLREAVERYVNDRDTKLSFSTVDNLLWWKFASKKCIRSFKKNQINCAMKEHNVQTYYILSRAWRMYQCEVLKKIIVWIFDGNEYQIDKFERKYQKEDRIRIIHWLKVIEECLSWNRMYYHSSDESDCKFIYF